jgi:hypothetical protein
MTTQSVHADGSRQEKYEERTLDNSFPSLKKYLFAGANILDVAREMVGVTKPEGLVVAADVDWGGMIFYPPCPALDEYLSRAREVQTDSNRNTHQDYQCGRKLYSYLRRAGLKDIQVEEAMHNIITSENGKAKELCELAKWYIKQDPVSDRILDESQKPSVARDLDNWGRHSDAFCMQYILLQVAGKVP